MYFFAFLWKYCTTDEVNGMELDVFVNRDYFYYFCWHRMEYFDDLASDQCTDQPPVTGLPAIAVKNIHLTGVKAYCDEFPAACRTTPLMHNSESVSHSLLRNYSDYDSK